jgi:PAS domain S-box-containing protein
MDGYQEEFDHTPVQRYQDLHQSLEQRGRQVRTITEVAQEIAAATALDELYQRVVTLVRERFGYYHVQIFRHDPDLDAMVVVEGYGQAGKKMKVAGHHLPFGKGVVGTAAATGQPVLVPDVTQDPNWVPHPDLPETQGELAVPIVLRNEVLGVLDVQNNADAAGALSEEDQVLLLGLAGQVAIAIESTRLAEETRQALADVQRSRDKLREVTELQKAILDSADYAIISTTPDGTITSFNPAAEEMLGYAAEEVVGKETPAIIHDLEEIIERAGIFSEELGYAIEPGFEVFVAKARHDLPNEYEWTYIRKDGSRFPVLLSVTALRDDEGQITGFLGIAKDITQQKQIEAQIEVQVQERTQEVAIFRSMAEGSLDAILISDLDGTISYANRAAHMLYGYDSQVQEMLGQSRLAFWLEKDAARLRETILPQVRAGGWQGEVHQKRRDGTTFEASISMFPLHDTQGAFVAWGTIVRDITVRKETEQRLMDQQVFLRQVIDMNPNLIFVKDSESRFILANETLARLYGTTPEGIIDKSDADFAAPDQAAKFREDDLRVLNAKEERVSPDRQLTDAEGNVHWVQATKRPIVDDDGVARRILGVSIDITERKKAEEERDRLQQKIIEAQQRAIQELSTPVIPVMERILIMPLIGSIDSMRAKDIMRALLAGIGEQRAKVVILDITGVPIVDSGVANHLNKTIMAARLKGARTIITGITDAVAETIVDLGIDWSDIETLSDLQTGLIVALGSLGTRLTSTK